MRSALLVWTGVLVVGSIVASGAALAPEALRRVDEFHVTRVVVHGAHQLAPDDAVAASGITVTTSIFDDEAVWLEGLYAHPLVRAAHVERELPGTVHIHVTETTPLALVQTPELRAADERGNVLPVRTNGLDLDLPIVGARSKIGTLDSSAGSGSPERRYLRVTDAPTLRALALLAVLERLDPELAVLVSEVEPYARHDVLLKLRVPAGLQVVLTTPPLPEQLRAVRLALAHLQLDIAHAPTPLRIDARYRDQVVVAPVAKPDRSHAGGAR